jgi:hypothetical protein
MKLIRDGKADLAFTLADTAFDAINGKNRFAPPEAKVDAKAIACHVLELHAPGGQGERGHQHRGGPQGQARVHRRGRVGYGNEGDPHPRGLRAQRGRPTYSRSVLPRRTRPTRCATTRPTRSSSDGGLPTSAVADLANSTPIKLIDQTDAIAKMNAKYGNFYFAAKIPKGTYKNEADVVTAGVANLLVVPSSFDANFVKAILTAMFDNQADLVLVHPRRRT